MGDTLATLATVDTTTASVRLILILMPTLLARLPTAFPSIMPTPLDTPTMLESSLELTTATDVCLAMEPLATVASMVDTTEDTTEAMPDTEAMLDTLESTTAKFTLSSHHHFA